MGKGICLVLSLMLMLSLVTVANAESDIMPCYAYVSSLSASLSINSGTAKAAGRIVADPSHEASITVRLQRQNSSGTWVTISSWTDSNSNGSSEAGGTKAITSGYDYRVYVTGKVYNSAGTVIETVNKYSTTKSY